jgi:glycosyltransferase involved in cell wall biosynthesis
MSDRVVAVSDYSRMDLISNYGVRENKTITINNPVVIRDAACDKEWEYGNDCVVCVGRYDPVKQHDRIIKAFSYVYQRNSNAKMILVGDGKNRDYLEYIADVLGIKGNVIFTGFTEKVGYYLLHSKVFVMASRTEGFPVSMTEAMAYKIPIVSTDSPGGCKEILGGEGTITEVTECKYGIMTPYVLGKTGKGQNIDEKERMLGEAILKLLSDKELHEHYAAMSAERATFYDYETIMKKWDDVIS